VSIIGLPYSGGVNPTTGEPYTDFERYSAMFEDPLIAKLRELQTNLYKLEHCARKVYDAHPLIKERPGARESALEQSIDTIGLGVSAFKRQLRNLEFNPVDTVEKSGLAWVLDYHYLVAGTFKKTYVKNSIALKLMGMDERLRKLLLHSFAKSFADFERISASVTPEMMAVQSFLESVAYSGTSNRHGELTPELYMPLCRMRDRYFADENPATFTAYIELGEKLLGNPNYRLAVAVAFPGAFQGRMSSLEAKLLELEVMSMLEVLS
jgi:hypothetical protein